MDGRRKWRETCKETEAALGVRQLGVGRTDDCE